MILEQRNLGALMATEKQIAANRRNATRSTGPRTAAGKQRSSQNSLKHGLTAHTRDTSLVADTEAYRFLELHLGSEANKSSQSQNLADAIGRLEHIRTVRSRLFHQIMSGQANTSILKQLKALDRYERYARTARRRAIRDLDILKEVEC